MWQERGEYGRSVTLTASSSPAEWAGISGDFPEINSTLVDKMLLFLDIRYVSDFIRQASEVPGFPARLAADSLAPRPLLSPSRC